VAARCRENVEGEETAREAAAKQILGFGRQRQQSGYTLERSERLREENPRKSNSKESSKERKPQRSAARSKIIEGAKNQQGR
jgi:hypothetical protein